MSGSVLRDGAEILPPKCELGLVLVARGACVASTEDGRRFHAPRGAALVLVGETTLTLSAGADLACFPAPEARLLRASLRPFVISAETLAREPRLSALAALLRAEPGPSRVSACLAEAFLWCASELPGAAAAANDCADPAVQRAIDLVEAALHRRQRVDEIARAVGLSRAAFARRFRAAVGEPPDRHFAALRLRRAAERLQLGDESLAEIAHAIGYASEFAFSRAFKRRYGIAPGTYRKQWQSLAHGLSAPVTMAA